MLHVIRPVPVWVKGDATVSRKRALMVARTLLLTSAALAVSAAVAHGQALEFSSAAYAGAAGARDAVAVDLNRDGWPDLVTANTGRNTIAILDNRADGTGFAVPREIAVGAGPFDVDAGDLNRDGIADLVVTTPDAHAIEVLLMGADGRPASRALVAPGSEAWGATLADVTRDGILDLLYTDYGRDRVVLLAGNGAGGFGVMSRAWMVGARPQGIAAADFNHDGLVDVAVAATGASGLDVLYGTAAGDFTRRTVAAGRPLNVLSVVDMNADGWAEIAGAATSSNVVVVFRGSASGFVSAGTRSVGSSPRGIAHGDFNQDGRPDLAVGNYGSGTATLLLGRRDGSVLPDVWGALPSGPGARAVAAADFDHDGRVDLAVAAQSAGRVWLHENTTPFVPPGNSFRRETGPGFYGLGDVGDFNENGLPDSLSGVAIYLDGVTRVPLAIESLTYVIDVDAADYNRDGHQDALLAKVTYDSGGRSTRAFLELHTGDGRGRITLARTIELTSLEIAGIRTADLDRDGQLDVAVFGYRDVTVVRSVGSASSARVAITLFGISGLQLADVTRDGILDAVVSRDASPAGYFTYPGDGTGGFGGSVAQSGGFAAYDFALGDMNHDGRPDIVSDGGHSVEIMAEGGWEAPVSFPSTIPWDTRSGSILGDFNNDGNLDFLSWGGAMLFGDGQGRLGRPFEFDVQPLGGLAFDWNRDGLLDIVHSGEVLLNERRAVNRPPVADAGPDRSYGFSEHINDDEWCERSTPSYDPDLHRLSYEWRDETGTVFTCAIPPHAPGTYTFRLTVRDGRGGESSDTMRVTIAPQPEIVLYTAHSWDRRGRWTEVNDPTAAASVRLHYPNLGAAKVGAPQADPADYVDLYFAADPTQTYKLWVRLKADGNYWGNDSIFVQFEDAVASDGNSYAVGSTSGLAVNLEECSGCGVSGWGWEDDGWGARGRNGVTVRFRQPGIRRIRIQVREDGVSVDQIVLSAVKYRTARPGTAKNDTVILPSVQ